MQERRHFIRWQVNRKVKLKLGGAENFMDCALDDVNFKGARVCLKQHLSLDKFLKVTIMFCEGNCCYAEAWIAWHKKSGDTNVYGFYFTKISDPDKDKIYQFIRCNCPDQIKSRWWSGLDGERRDDTMQNGNGMPEDKRIFARFMTNLQMKFLDLNSNREGIAETKDISAKGIGIETNEELSPRTPLEMWLKVPDQGQPLYTRGQVVWSKMVESNRFMTGIELERADLMGMSRVLRSVL